MTHFAFTWLCWRLRWRKSSSISLTTTCYVAWHDFSLSLYASLQAASRSMSYGGGGFSGASLIGQLKAATQADHGKDADGQPWLSEDAPSPPGGSDESEPYGPEYAVVRHSCEVRGLCTRAFNFTHT
jgi:hypothetical protein